MRHTAAALGETDEEVLLGVVEVVEVDVELGFRVEPPLLLRVDCGRVELRCSATGVSALLSATTLGLLSCDSVAAFVIDQAVTAERLATARTMPAKRLRLIWMLR